MFAAAAAVAASSANSLLAADEKPGSKSPNEKLGVAVVGCGGRGKDHLKHVSEPARHRSAVHRRRRRKHRQEPGRSRRQEAGPRAEDRRRHARGVRRQDRSTIVTTATPNHWHALVSIWAMQAGKDVYVEKPVSHNVSEGRRIVEAARKYNTHLPDRHAMPLDQGHAATPCSIVHDGKIGKVNVARGLCYKRRPSIGPLGNYPIPKGVNYDLWLGPAPVRSADAAAICTTIGTAVSLRQRRPGQPGHPPDGLVPLGTWASTSLSNSVLSYGGRLGYEDAGDTANTQMIIHDYGD